MSDDTQNPAEGDQNTGADPLYNLKQETNRKLDDFSKNVDSKISALAESQQQLLAQLQSMTKQAQPEPKSDDLADIMYSDPERYAQIIEERAEARISKKQEAEKARAGELNRTVAGLTQQFPELNDPTNALTRRVYEMYGQIDPSEQSAAVLKATVLEAAVDLGVQPYNKRKKGDDSFSLGGNTGTSKPQRSTESQEVPDATLQWAKLLGLDVSNKDMQNRLKQRSERKNWMKYE